MNKPKKTRIAAVADIHVKDTDHGKWSAYFRSISEAADVLLICGDLTDTGKASEAEVLAEELHACKIPVVAVLGNHDCERDEQEDIINVLCNDDIFILNGGAVTLCGVGFAGVKGFGGGFDRGMLSMFGEKMMKQFVQEAVDEALKLENALVRLDSDYPGIKKIALLHYAPIKDTIIGEPDQIFPFLGCSRLAEPINRRKVDAVFHGHAHIGTFQGATGTGIPVYNVSKPVLQKKGMAQDFFIYEVDAMEIPQQL